MRVLSEASDETSFLSHSRIAAWTSCACSVVATLPVPMALFDVNTLFLQQSSAKCDSPDGLIGNDNLAPVLDLVGYRLELRGNMADRLALLPLLQALTAAQNHTQSSIQRGLGLAGHKLVVLFQDDTALRVPNQCPSDAEVLERFSRGFPREGTAGLVVNVLGCDFDTLAGGFACEGEIGRWWGNDDLCVCLLANA